MVRIFFSKQIEYIWSTFTQRRRSLWIFFLDESGKGKDDPEVDDPSCLWGLSGHSLLHGMAGEDVTLNRQGKVEQKMRDGQDGTCPLTGRLQDSMVGWRLFYALELA